MYSELIHRLTEVSKRIHAMGETLHIEVAQRELRALEEKMGQPGFWDNNEKAQETITQIKRLKKEIEPVQVVTGEATNLLEFAKIAEAENDSGPLEEIERETKALEKKLEEIELQATLNEPHDPSNAFVSIQAGAGGTESCDWANMLARMYKRFAEKQCFDTEMVHVVDGEEAGIRSITYHFKGPYAYGFMKCETGVHRLVRNSPFDAKGRRHTSFAAVDVISELP